MTSDEIRKLAQEQYVDENIDIDDDAVVSVGDMPGAYVAAWVWVAFPECED